MRFAVCRCFRYQGGYRANIVAYAIAKTAHDVGEKGRAVDFQGIWRRQAPTPAMEAALTLAAEVSHDMLIGPPQGLSNVTEWAKNQACWERVRRVDIAWSGSFLDELISTEERQEEVRGARREQRELNGIEMQIVIVNAGSAFWTDALAWGSPRGPALTPTELGILRVVAAGRTPSEKQSTKALEALSKLQSEGYTGELRPDS